MPAVSNFSSCKRWWVVKCNLFLPASLRWHTSRGSMRSVSEPTVLSCSKMGDCVGCRWHCQFFFLIFPPFSTKLTVWLKFFFVFIQIATKHKIYLFDILELGARAFKNGLSQILENKHILKVCDETWQRILPIHTNPFFFTSVCILYFGTDHSQLPSYFQLPKLSVWSETKQCLWYAGMSAVVS